MAERHEAPARHLRRRNERRMRAVCQEGWAESGMRPPPVIRVEGQEAGAESGMKMPPTD